MKAIQTLVASKYSVWFVLALPAWEYVHELFYPSRHYPEIMQFSGELSIQMLVFTLCITPLTLILRYFEWGKTIARWLLRNRRYIGVAGFAYAVIHTILYVRQTFDLELIWLEALDWPLGTGWICLIILLPIALTSNKTSINMMGKSWKVMQRFSYLAIIAGFAHWLLLDFFIDNAMMWIIPLVIAKLVHLGFRLYSKFKSSAPKAQVS
jgi:sulfoxide reductase heme-binding subunit YedZ